MDTATIIFWIFIASLLGIIGDWFCAYLVVGVLWVFVGAGTIVKEDWSYHYAGILAVSMLVTIWWRRRRMRLHGV